MLNPKFEIFPLEQRDSSKVDAQLSLPGFSIRPTTDIVKQTDVLIVIAKNATLFISFPVIILWRTNGYEEAKMVWLEALSYLVTILGFPTAILVFVYEHRRRLANEEIELHRNLSEEYDNFLRLVLENSDLLLLKVSISPSTFSEEQVERREILYRMLVSLFEKAYIILYSEYMKEDAKRRWMSWEDDMREWCRKEEFASLLPELLEGEDDAFSQHILAITPA